MVWTANPAELAICPSSGPTSLTPSVFTALRHGPNVSHEGQSRGPVEASWLDLNLSQAHVPAGELLGSCLSLSVAGRESVLTPACRGCWENSVTRAVRRRCAVSVGGGSSAVIRCALCSQPSPPCHSAPPALLVSVLPSRWTLLPVLQLEALRLPCLDWGVACSPTSSPSSPLLSELL